MRDGSIIGCEPLPGYRIIERIGSGGYGDVYSAEAPGGLIKVIKIVRGQYMEKRATDELKALKRIRDVRHPFLLSIERIEIVDGQLLVVTELADESLRDRFDKCRKTGQRGISRDKLLGYMRDAAEALDYMSEEHSLQHLDIKPENILLLADRVKVADFGLVKSINTVVGSLVGGLTPTYAAPEVFRGTPSMHSDQYSLAVMYQQMLTGRLPFCGQSAAELTLQHLNDEPDLSRLAEGEQPIIARALDKNPDRRFETSIEMVRALMDVEVEEEDEQTVGEESVDVANSRSSSFATQMIDFSAYADEFEPELPIRIPTLAAPDVTNAAPPVARDATSPAVPVVVIGIGGTAAKVLRQLRGRLAMRFGDASRMPSLQMLLLDSDPQTLLEAGEGKVETALKRDEMMALSLRRPQDYRAMGSTHLEWLGRRWLYNIPRSLRTEGLRPLGRLAFIDHARRAQQRIRQAVLRAASSEALQVTAETLGTAVAERPVRVYVVASINGGTGSGCAVDVGYAVQHTLDRLELPADQVIGVMLHSTSRSTRAQELARLNAFSFLSEFNHFNRPGSVYPGDASSGVPGSEGQPAFAQTYLVDLGESLEADAYDEAAASVAEYIHLDAFTAARSFLAACREVDADPARTFSVHQAALRTFSLSRKTATRKVQLDRVAADLCLAVLHGWIDVGIERRRTREDDLRRTLIERVDLRSKSLVAKTSECVTAVFKNGIEAFFQQLAAAVRSSGPEMTTRLLLDYTDAEFGGPLTAPDEITACRELHGQSLEVLVEEVESDLSRQLEAWLWGQMDDPNRRLPGTIDSAEWLCQELKRLHDQTNQYAIKFARDLIAMRHRIARPDPDAAAGMMPSPQDQVLPYFQGRLALAGVQAAAGIVRRLQAEFTSCRQQVFEVGRQIRQLIEQAVAAIDETAPTCTAPSAGTSEPDAGGLQFTPQQKKLAGLLDRRLQQTCIRDRGGLARLLTEGAGSRGELVKQLEALSRQFVHEGLSGSDTVRKLLGSDAEVAIRRVKSAISKTSPSFAEFGGEKRYLTLLPAATSETSLLEDTTRAVADVTAVELHPENELTVCCEACGLSLLHIALRIIDGRRDYADFAERVHTRTDVKWESLIAGMPLETVAH